MQVAPKMVVSIEYELRSDAGEVLDSSKGADSLTYIHGIGQIIPGLEAALVGRAAGDSFRVPIPARDAYGERDPSRVVSVRAATQQELAHGHAHGAHGHDH
jgi:FKBP-type peptidyl-prolyl cis-trans isomerase SlyD